MTGCIPGQYYHSSAGIPRYSRTVYSELTVVRTESGQERSYGIIVAVDQIHGGKKLNYLLIAPVVGLASKPSLEDFNLDACSVLTVDNALALLVELDKAIKQWESKEPAADGVFYEFTVAPEQAVKTPGLNAGQAKSYVEFTCRITGKNKAARLQYGLENVNVNFPYPVYAVNFESIENLKDLKLLLDRGVDMIQSKDLMRK